MKEKSQRKYELWSKFNILDMYFGVVFTQDPPDLPLSYHIKMMKKSGTHHGLIHLFILSHKRESLNFYWFRTQTEGHGSWERRNLT
jgi:hypothetical protein